MLKVKKEGIILEQTNLKFENHAVFNPGCIAMNGQIHMLYRAVTKANFSSIGYCRLDSPLKIAQRNTTPVMIPEYSYESFGLEDPRIVNIDGTYLMTYTAYDGTNAFGSLATSTDLKNFRKEGIITPQLTYKEYKFCVECCEGLNEKYLRFVKLFYERAGEESTTHLKVWDKDVVFFPRKINGQYAFLHRIYPDIQIVYFNNIKELDYSFWRNYLCNVGQYIVLHGKHRFEESYIGGGCPPIETEDGWLMIYHGVEDTSEGYVYHAGAALLDLKNPQVEIGRLKQPLFSPELEWEKYGVVNNVVFPTGAIVKDEMLYIYYGAADKRIGVASVNLKELITEIKRETP